MSLHPTLLSLHIHPIALVPKLCFRACPNGPSINVICTPNGTPVYRNIYTLIVTIYYENMSAMTHGCHEQSVTHSFKTQNVRQHSVGSETCIYALAFSKNVLKCGNARVGLDVYA